ncbi:MAG: type IV pilus assembly protein PilM [bacterium]|nr:type IV pilus assembly protein PilM [bacterium]
MSNFGLDIGSTSIKMVQAEKSGDKYRLVAAGIVPTPQPGFSSESQADLESLATCIKNLHQEAKVTTKKVIVALPESEVFTRVIEFPPMSDGELEQAVPWEAEQFVPRPLSEVELDWHVISKGEGGREMGKMKVYVAAAPRELVAKYLKVLNLAGFEVVSIETEMIALARIMVPASAPATILLDLGARTTDVGIIQKGDVVFARTIPTAGEAFTRAISANLALEVTQAEEYKRAYGLEEAQLEGKIRQALGPVFKVVVDEVKRSIQAWKEKEQEPLVRLILTGGTAGLPQASSVLAHELGIEVQIADPFSQLILPPQVSSNLKSNSCLFAVAAGLALKEI